MDTLERCSNRLRFHRMAKLVAKVVNSLGPPRTERIWMYTSKFRHKLGHETSQFRALSYPHQLQTVISLRMYQSHKNGSRITPITVPNVHVKCQHFTDRPRRSFIACPLTLPTKLLIKTTSTLWEKIENVAYFSVLQRRHHIIPH